MGIDLSTDLAGKNAIVTGASSGIGRATARAIAASGGRVAITGRSEGRLSGLASELGKDTLCLPADVSNPDSVEALVRDAIAELGNVDILVANAGVYEDGKVSEGNPDRWDQLIATNISSVFRIVRATLPHMQDQGSGDIVITNSIAGHQVFEIEPVYSASKHAVGAFARGLRQQLRQNDIRVSCVSPGTVATALWGMQEEATMTERVRMGLALRPDDVADAIIYMLTRPRHVAIRDIIMLPQAEDI